MARKTIDMMTVLERGNFFLANSDAAEKERRYGVAGFLESLLHDAEVYAGFGYLPSAKSTTDIDGGQWNAEDDSRRVYFIHKKLR